MMGDLVGRQDRLFYEFDLEDIVPSDHLLRRIDAALDLSWLRGAMKAHYSRRQGAARRTFVGLELTNMLQCKSPVMAMNRHPVARNRLPLYLRKQTFSWPSLTSGCDPTRTSSKLA